MRSLSGSAVTSRHQTTWASLRLLINTDQLLLFTPSVVDDNTKAKDSPAPPSVRLWRHCTQSSSQPLWKQQFVLNNLVISVISDPSGHHFWM